MRLCINGQYCMKLGKYVEYAVKEICDGLHEESSIFRYVETTNKFAE